MKRAPSIVSPSNGPPAQRQKLVSSVPSPARGKQENALPLGGIGAATLAAGANVQPSAAAPVVLALGGGTRSAAASQRPPGTQDVDVGQETAERMKLLANKHKDDLYRCIRAKVVKAGLSNPRNPQSAGFQLLGEDGKHFHITLMDSWYEEYQHERWMLAPGDIVHLLGDPAMYRQIEKTKHCELSDAVEHQYRLLIMHPDILLTGTAVSNALTCRRYALIQYEINEGGAVMTAGSKALVLGNIVHNVLQSAMAAQDFSDAFLDANIRENVQSSLVQLWQLQMTTDEMFSECKGRLKTAREWAQKYYAPLNSAGMLSGAGNNRNDNKPKPRVARLVGNEQNVCSHRFGFKGKLDGLVRTDANKTTALEIKTGKIKTEHVGQITVYYLLLCDLVNQQLKAEMQACSDEGLLLYPHKDQYTYNAKKINRFDIRPIIAIRNTLASTVQRRRQTLEDGKLRGPIWPKMLEWENGQEPHECKRCFRQSQLSHAAAPACKLGGCASSTCEKFNKRGSVVAQAATKCAPFFLASRWRARMISAVVIASHLIPIWGAWPSKSSAMASALRFCRSAKSEARKIREGGGFLLAQAWPSSRRKIVDETGQPNAGEALRFKSGRAQTLDGEHQRALVWRSQIDRLQDVGRWKCSRARKYGAEAFGRTRVTDSDAEHAARWSGMRYAGC
eukprot:g8816.t1